MERTGTSRSGQLQLAPVAAGPRRSRTSFGIRNVCLKLRHLILLVALGGCCTKPVLVPVASVHYDGFKEAREIIATLNAHGISATPEGEATVVFPILVPKSKFATAVSILRTNSLVTSEEVRLYTTITREVK